MKRSSVANAIMAATKRMDKAFFLKRSYSQFGEDILIQELLRRKDGFYVDVGAFHPWRYSNTALLHEKGWRGINIDADARAIAMFEEARPNDINLNVGVGEHPGEMDFFIFEAGAVSSFKPEARYLERFGRPDPISIPVQPLSTIFERHLPAEVAIDYMDIDCEGFDDKVLRGNDWSRFRPAVISVELSVSLMRFGENASVRLLIENGYMLRAHYFATAIFHRTDAM